MIKQAALKDGYMFKKFLRYGKCKILNTFLFLFSNKMLAFRAGICKILARIANREDSDQMQSDLGLRCLSRPFR